MDATYHRKGLFLRVFLSKLEKLLIKNNETRSTGQSLQIFFSWVYFYEFFSPNFAILPNVEHYQKSIRNWLLSSRLLSIVQCCTFIPWPIILNARFHLQKVSFESFPFDTHASMQIASVYERECHYTHKSLPHATLIPLSFQIFVFFGNEGYLLFITSFENMCWGRVPSHWKIIIKEKIIIP